MGWQWHQLDHMQVICTSLKTDNHTSTSSLNFYRQDALPDTQPTLPPSHRGYQSNDLWLEGKRENYHVCSAQYCVQQLCTVQCAHILTNLPVVCWLDLAFLWLYCVLQFVRLRFSFLGLFMATLCNRGAIIFLPCSFFLSIYLSTFFPRLISAATDWMSTILCHMVWP